MIFVTFACDAAPAGCRPACINIPGYESGYIELEKKGEKAVSYRVTELDPTTTSVLPEPRHKSSNRNPANPTQVQLSNFFLLNDTHTLVLNNDVARLTPNHHNTPLQRTLRRCRSPTSSRTTARLPQTSSARLATWSCFQSGCRLHHDQRNTARRQ